MILPELIHITVALIFLILVNGYFFVSENDFKKVIDNKIKSLKNR